MTTPNGTTDPRWTALCEQIALIADPNDRDRAGDILTDAYSLGISVGIERAIRQEAPTRGTGSTQPAEQDPDAHTDGSTAQGVPEATTEQVRAALDAGHVRAVVVYCDNCGIRAGGDYIGPTTAARIATARQHLATFDGWDITPNHDLCPNCKTSKIIDPEQVAVSIGSLAARKSGGWRQARPGETPGQVEPDDAQPQPQDLRALLAGRSDHDVVSVELLRRILADGPGPVELIDPEDLASLRRKAAMLPVVLLWRDHTANALSALVAAADEQEEPSKALLDAAAHAREVLTVDPEKAYGFAGPVASVIEVDELREQLATLTAELADVQANARQYAQDTEDHIAGLDARLTRMSRRLKAARRDLAQAEQDARTARAEIQRLGDQLAEADTDNRRLAANNARLRQLGAAQEHVTPAAAPLTLDRWIGDALQAFTDAINTVNSRATAPEPASEVATSVELGAAMAEAVGANPPAAGGPDIRVEVLQYRNTISAEAEPTPWLWQSC